MYFEPLEIPDNLLVAQENGKLVIFAGAGTAMGAPSNLPSFMGLAKQIASGTSFGASIDKYENNLDRFLGDLARNGVDVQGLCREIIGTPNSQPNELHRSLVGLFIDPADVRIVTTNFDQHFSTVLSEQAIQSDRYYAPALPLGNNFKGLVCLHGSLLRPEPLVLTDEDFGRAYLSEGWARQFLQHLFAEFTILFVGYSHTDVPVQYLARGMSARLMAPRYALAAEGDTDLWRTLGVNLITFEKIQGPNPYENLYEGIAKWARFSRQQPTDIAARVREIVCAPEQFKADRAQSSLLKRCLERKDSCHFFTQQAKGWAWVQWVNEQGLLPPLFDPTHNELNPQQLDLAFWLGPILVAEQSADALLLVEQHNGKIGRQLWSVICRNLGHNEALDWNAPLTHKWLLLLMATRPENSLFELSVLLPIVVQKAPRKLGLLLLRSLLTLKITLTRGMDFRGLVPTGESFHVSEKAEFEIVLACERHFVETTWNQNLKQQIGEIHEELLTLFEDKLREAHEIWHSAGRATSTYEPGIFRGRISDRDVHHSSNGLSIVVDFTLDVIEGMTALGSGLAQHRIFSWILSDVPTLVRLGLYALHLSKSITPSAQISFLLNHDVLFPSAYGATHESYLVLTDAYPYLTESERKSLWHAINRGPSDTLCEGATPQQQAEARQYQIDNLTWWLATKNPKCALAIDALHNLKERSPDFTGHEGMDRVMIGSGGQLMGGSRSPKTTAELIGEPLASQLDFLLTYSGGTAPFEQSRKGLLETVRDAASQNQAWSLALLKELDARQQWKNDLWEAAFWGMKFSLLSQEELNWLLTTLDAHFAESSSIRGLSDFLYFQVDLSEGKEPTEANLELMIRLSLHIWELLKTAEPARTEKFEETEWLNVAINHPAGHISDFWMKLCGRMVRKNGGQSPGIPNWLTAPLADFIAGRSFAAQLGMVILGERLPFVQFLDSAWVRRQLFPRFRFSEAGEAAFLLWEPHVCHGRLSRDLILEMPPIYRQAFSRFCNVRRELFIGFSQHIGAIVYSGLFDVNAEGWLMAFLLGLNDDHRTEWANQMGLMLNGAPPDRKTQIWRQWMQPYWQERLRGRPCAISEKEAEELVDWTLAMTPVFSEAVEMLIQGPAIRGGRKLGTAIYVLKKNDTPLVHPEAVLRLLNWLLEQKDEPWMIYNDIEGLIFRLPKRKQFLEMLNNICQKLTSLGYGGAENLKKRIENDFCED